MDVSTLSTSTVRLKRTSDGVLIPGTVDTTGGGDAIVYQPMTPLDANTGYTFEVTDQVKDTTGAAFPDSAYLRRRWRWMWRSGWREFCAARGFARS